MAAERYAVVGHPIGHSRSPFIHARFAAEVGHDIVYEALDVAPQEFVQRVDAFREDGGRGLNVTVPLKTRALDYASRLTPRARRAGAVNTLVFDAGDGVLGDNTDGVGLMRDLASNLGWPVHGRQVLVLGAGGATRGVLGPLVEAGPSGVVVANRTRHRAERLAAEFADLGAPVRGTGLDDLAGGPFQLVVNATSAALAGEAPVFDMRALASDARGYDMMYAATPTPFLAALASFGVGELADGRGMLVEQAAESFWLWRGVRPSTAPVITALGELLAGDASLKRAPAGSTGTSLGELRKQNLDNGLGS